VSDSSQDLEARVAELAEALRLLERRVAGLEARPAAPARRPAPAPAPSAPPGEAPLPLPGLGELLSLGGRTLLVLAGAFVLRALTDAGTLPAWLGAGLGFAYAGTWIALADRAGGAGRAWSAGFHGLAAAAIGFPLLFEATYRFKLLSPVQGTLVLALLAGVALAVSVRRGLVGLAWIATVGSLFAAVALMIPSGRVAPPALFLVLLGVATLWIGYVKDWTGLRWPVALAADLAAAILALRAVAPAAGEGPVAALVVQGALVALYLGSIGARTLLLDRSVVAFEVTQTAGALAVGLGGAVLVAGHSGMGQAGFGLLCIAWAAASYAVAFAFVERRQRSRANFSFYSSAAVAFAVAGLGLLLPVPWMGLACSALAAAAAGLARRRRRLVLVVHAAAYGVAASLGSGLLAYAAAAIGEPADRAWPPATAAGALAVLLLLVSAWQAAGAAKRDQILERLPQLLLVAAAAAGAAGLAAGWLAGLFAGAPGPGARAGAVAAIRTAVLSVGAIGLAGLGRSPAWVEARWLAWPVLGAVGFKILLEDLPRSRPATLVLSFAFYGAALILVPRLRPRRGAPASGAPAKAAAPAEPAAAPAPAPAKGSAAGR
jgi:hypothetical protein